MQWVDSFGQETFSKLIMYLIVPIYHPGRPKNFTDFYLLLFQGKTEITRFRWPQASQPWIW